MSADFPSTSEFPPELADAYEPVARLGGGRAGTVWHARERDGRRTVALKVARRDPASADVEFARCQREGRVAQRLKHRHVAAVVDAGVRGDVAYCAWRFCAAGTLAARQAAGERLELPAILTVVREVASALEHARERGVWHGALSPHAVLFDSVGCCQVADFRIVEDEDDPEVALPLPAKSPTYHPPELRTRSGAVEGGALVDQYALALIAYELLTGERRELQLGSGVTYVETLEVPLHRELRPGLATRVNEVLARATAVDPSHRYESVDAFADALADACVADGERVAPGVLPAARASGRWTRVAADGTESLSPTARILVATGGVACFLVLFLGYVFTSQASQRAGGDPTAVHPLALGAALAVGVLGDAPSSAARGPAGVSESDLALLQARTRLGGLLVVPIGGGAGAAAVVDGVDRGAVPRMVRLLPGEHRVALRDGTRRYAPAETTVTVTSGALITVNFRPVP
ncbi:serine/threonine-protein kinase [Roseisolibacter sp. H3M3-2]|uniref:serine/threonine-protein kinase n=1 Tax=Roseisolibacter sp. H3M3-2 TaxID=3031323 RepID=UPI0023DA6895|nr:serine/threonine-protein kinase [Roseisolibacter sp. H3M3-2]MDF1501863.1 serine/threonine-protein kinase [Roseisolibacter sp. H3M3-2]